MLVLVFGRGRPVHLTALAVALIPAALFPALMAWFWFRQSILPRVTFDREAGLMRMGWKGLRGRRPLSSIIGVQVMQTRKQFGGPELNIPAVTMYQLNLILDNPAERRLNVMTCDPITARAKARLVADFLGVPVLDSAGARRAPPNPPPASGQGWERGSAPPSRRRPITGQCRFRWSRSRDRTSSSSARAASPWQAGSAL